MLIALYIFLGIIGFILLILIMPFCYRGKLHYDNSEDKLPKASFSLGYLFIIRFKLTFDKELKAALRIAGIPLFKMGYDSKDKDNEKENANKKSKNQEYEELCNIEDINQGSSSDTDNEKDCVDTTSKTDKSSADEADQTTAEQSSAVEENPSTSEAEGTEAKEKIPLTERIKNLYEKVKCKIKGIYDNIKKGYRNVEFYLDLLDSELFRSCFALIKKNVKKLCKTIFPRRLKGKVHFGFEDPETTGKVLSYAALLYLVYRKNLVIEPDFETEEMCIKADISFSGHFNIITVAIIGIRIYFNKDVKHMLFKLKNKDRYIEKKYRSKGDRQNGGE